METQDTMNSKNMLLIEVETIRSYWKDVTSKQKVCSFYKASDEDGFLSNSFTHEAFDYCIPFGSFQGEKIPVTFSKKALMLNKASLMGDRESFERIVQSNDPKESKNHGKNINPWNEELWQKYLCAITKDVIYSKFGQVEDLRKGLIKISDDYIAEASIKDVIWGIGLAKTDENVQIPANWKGANVLGWALMEARWQLKHEAENALLQEEIALRD